MPSSTPDGRIHRRRRLGAATLLGYPVMAGCIAYVHFGWAWAVAAALPGYFAAFTVYMASLLFPLVAMYSGRGMSGWLAAGIAGTAATALIGLIWPIQLRYYREESRQVPADRSLADVLSHVLGEGYLAMISGGNATWVLESAGSPLAVVAQQWSHPRFLTDPHQRVAMLADQRGAVQLFFRYRLQEDPDAVFADLQPASTPGPPNETSPS